MNTNQTHSPDNYRYHRVTIVFICVAAVVGIFVAWSSQQFFSLRYTTGDSSAYYADSTTIVYRTIEIPINLGVAAVLLIVGLTAAVIFFFELDWFIFVFVLLVPITRQIPIVNDVVAKLGAITFIALWLSRKLLSGEKIVLFDKPIRWFIASYLLWIAFTTILSTDFTTSVVTLVRQTLFFAVIYAFMDWIRDWQQVRLLIFAFCLSGGIAAIAIIMQTVSQIMMGGGLDLSSTGLFNSTTAAGLHLYMVTPLLLALGISRRYLAKHERNLILATGGTFVVALFLTGARESILGIVFAVTYLIFALRVWNQRIFWILSLLGLSLAAAVSIAIIADPGFADHLVRLGRLDNPLSGRDVIWARTLDIIRDYPIWGAGPETLSKQISIYASKYNQEYQVRGAIWGGDAHNVLLTAWATTGVIGALLIAVFFVRYFAMANAALRWSKHDTRSRVILYGCIATLVGYGAQAMFGARAIVGGSLGEGLVLWLIIVITLWFYQHAKKIRSFQ